MIYDLRFKNNKGFTIIELLVTITIIALLTTIGVTGYQAVSKSGRDALRKSDLEQLRSALEIYKSENGSYPTATSVCIADLTSDYLNTYPNDPKNPTYKYCYVRNSNLSYVLCAHLENGDTSDDCGGTNACGDDCNYSVDNP